MMKDMTAIRQRSALSLAFLAIASGLSTWLGLPAA